MKEPMAYCTGRPILLSSWEKRFGLKRSTTHGS